MVSQVAWLNFDAEQQRRTQLMMAALTSQGAVDELGLGIARDLIADVLHPGLSVLHTRARYLLFVPRAFRHLKGHSVDKLQAEAQRAEGKLVNQLVAHYANIGIPDEYGIIGRRTAGDTKQPPSFAYWGLIRSLEILRIGGSSSDYFRALAGINSAGTAHSLLHSEDDEAAGTDSLWREIPKQPDVFGGFELTADEAHFLQDRAISSERRNPEHRSLFSWLLDPAHESWFSGMRYAWEYPLASEFPSHTNYVMHLGRDLDRFIHGARILYNYLCAVQMPPTDKKDEWIERYRSAMEAWSAELSAEPVSAERLDQLNGWALFQMANRRASQGALARWRSTYRFIKDWETCLGRGTSLLANSVAADLITRREKALKPGRARLNNPDKLRVWLGASGYFRFDYNWAVCDRLLTDIHRGLGTTITAVDAQ
ncbi:DUF6361 family protein [Smaragdicoccus niigatensis]|nr:DUF6361 family protein [Smaragdicoccus niigatensis]